MSSQDHHIMQHELPELKWPISVPGNIKIRKFIGEGARLYAYLVARDGKKAVLKLYKTEFIDKYHRRYKHDIAQFEMV